MDFDMREVSKKTLVLIRPKLITQLQAEMLDDIIVTSSFHTFAVEILLRSHVFRHAIIDGALVDFSSWNATKVNLLRGLIHQLPEIDFFVFTTENMTPLSLGAPNIKFKNRNLSARSLSEIVSEIQSGTGPH